jgi:hypothetical protein
MFSRAQDFQIILSGPLDRAEKGEITLTAESADTCAPLNKYKIMKTCCDRFSLLTPSTTLSGLGLKQRQNERPVSYS